MWVKSFIGGVLFKQIDSYYCWSFENTFHVACTQILSSSNIQIVEILALFDLMVISL